MNLNVSNKNMVSHGNSEANIIVNSVSKDYYIRDNTATGARGIVNSLFKNEKKRICAVKDISFNINKGEVVGFIGPNGAGKSTTIKMLTGIIVPTSGKISVCGNDPVRNRVANAKNIGAVFGQRSQLWWDLPVIESYRLLKEIYKIDEKVYSSNLDMFIDMLDMNSYINQPVRQLSLGQRMRSDIVAAFLHNPNIVFLDEPTLGLDVFSKRKMRSFIKEINRELKTTIILTSHDMNEIEELCQRVLIINHGSLVFDGSFETLKKLYSGKTILKVQLNQEYGNNDLDKLKQFGNLLVTENGFDLHISVTESIIPAFTTILSCYDVCDVDVVGANIDEVIEEVFRK